MWQEISLMKTTRSEFRTKKPVGGKVLKIRSIRDELSNQEYVFGTHWGT